MEDEVTPDNVIFFIYSQSHYRQELTKFTKKTHIVEMKQLKEYKIGGKSHYIFYMVLKDTYNKEQIEVEFEKDTILYSSKFVIKDINYEIFLFKIDFTPKEKNKNMLSKFTMDFSEQFQLFLKLKEEEANLRIGFSEEYLKNLCVSAINFISSINEDILTLDFLFKVFINSYLIQKKGKNFKKNVIKLFFDSLKIKSISSKNTDLKQKNIDNSEYEKYFSEAEKIQKELVEIGGEENIDKINIILAYYFLKNSPKNFVKLICLKNNYSKNIFQNLKNNSKIFNDFSAEIIDFKLLDEAENIEQIKTLLKLLPNMVELFKEFLNFDFFLKLSNISQIENKCIDVLDIMSPKSTDDLDSLYNYFFVAIEICESEGIVTFKLQDKFFLDYANFYAKNNLQNLKLIRDMYEKYSPLTNINKKAETIRNLNSLYYEAGVQLIKKDKFFKNDEIINFFLESREKRIKNIGPEDVSQLIDLNAANEEFINNFLNNNFKKFDLKEFFGDQYDTFIQKIFENFKEPSDFSNIKIWKISPNVNEEVLKYCIRRISLVLSQDNTKSSFTDLINFLCNLFSFGSRKMDDFIEELKDVEKNIPNNKLIEVYFKILHKGEKIYPISNIFNKHLIKYIENNAGNGPLSVWYRLVAEESNERVAYLYKNLKTEYAVKKEDFIDYPNKIEETISLYTYLYFGKYFSYNYITELDYYKNSINAKKELMNLTYEQAEKIFIKYKQYYKLFRLFIPIKQYNEKNYNSEFVEFHKQLKHYKSEHDSLLNIINYYKQFFSGTKNTEIISLQNLIESINKSPLTSFYDKKELINEYLKYVEIAKNRIKLINSIIFMSIYNEKKSKLKGQEEDEIFQNSLEQFKVLKNIENIDTFNEEFKKLIGESFSEKVNKVMEEINFIFSYFGLSDDHKKKAEIKFKIEELIQEIIPEPLPPLPPIPEIDPFLKDVKDRADDCIYFYNKYKNEDSQESLIIEKIKLFFDQIFKTDIQEKVQSYEKDQFLFIVKRMLLVYLINNNINKSSINNEDIFYLFKEFYEFYEVYKNAYNNDISSLSINLKNIYKSFCEKLKDKVFKDILAGLKVLFNSMENENERKIKFSTCFTNVLEIEITKSKSSILNSRDKIELILDTIFTFLNDNFVPLIDLLSNDKISSFNDIYNIEKIFNNILYDLLGNYNKSDQFKEQMLYYFESKISYILFEKEKISTQDFFSEKKIKYIKNIVSTLENYEKKGNKNVTIIILFYIAYLKVILKKYIDLINEQNDLKNDKINKIFLNKTKLIETLTYYILKLYYDKEGNFRDFLSASRDFIRFSIDFDDKINNIENYYGLDYLFLPLDTENSKKYNEIIKIILNNLKNQEDFKNDLGILSDINKSNIDVFYCIISNLFLSHFTDQNYFDSTNYSNLKKWFEDRLKQNKFENINEYQKQVNNIFINSDLNTFEYTKDLLNLLFALRLTLNSLSLNKSSFFYKLIVNPKEIISSHQKFLKYFFNSKNNLEKMESFRLFRFILLSHLLFSYKLGKIDLEEIKNVSNISIGNKDKIFKILTEEFDSIIKIIRYKGIKVKYIIIYMNIVFEEIKSMKLNENKPEFEVKILESILTPEFYSRKIKKYFSLLKETGISQDNNEFIKLLYEDYDFYNNKDNIDKLPYLNYFTTPNLCSKEDFEYQYISSMERHPIIEIILNEGKNEIISIVNCLPKINSFINNVYNKLVLSISREEAENRTINSLNSNNDDINNFKEIVSKFINNYDISNESKLLEILNIKDNKIYKLYDSIIKKYNQLFSKLAIYNNNKEFLLPSIVQDFSRKISLFEKPEEGLNELKKIISIYSKRKRLIIDNKNYKLDIYNGDKIDYDFQLIENILEKKYFIDINIFEQNQRTFIFSNNVFSDKRNNILTEIIEKFKQEPIKENKKLPKIESNKKDFNISIYHDLQFIIINLQSLIINCEKEKVSFKDIAEMIFKKYGYKINEILHFDDIYVNNILSIYEKYEEVCFQYFKELLIPKNLTNEKDNDIKYYLNNLELIKEDDISKATKKYLMRYCLGDYDKKENILKNMKIDKMILKKDIWEEKIFNNIKFKEDCEKLSKINIENDNYLDKCFLFNIINDIKSVEKEVKTKININPSDDDKNEEKNISLKIEVNNNRNQIVIENPKVDSEDEHPKVDSEDEHPKVDSEDEHPKVDSEDEHPKVDSEDERPKVDSEDEHPKVDSEDDE